MKWAYNLARIILTYFNLFGQKDGVTIQISPFGLYSYSDFRMVGDEVALTAANPKLDVKVSLHPAFQCMVIGY